MTGLVFLACLVAWALLALGLQKHHAEWFGRPPTALQRGLLRGHGWLGLAFALGLALRAHGVEFGLVLWATAMMLAAITWVLALAARSGFSAGDDRQRAAGGARQARPGRRRS